MPLAWPPYMVTLLHTLSCDSLVNMAETAEDHRTSSENETSGVTGSAESIDLSCIHWGYLNCTLLKDPKKIKDNIWQTFWVDLCGSTLRLYKDLSLPQNSADQPPPSSLSVPSNENEKKEAFIVLKKGTKVQIIEPGFESHKSQKRKFTVNRRHVFKVSFTSGGTNSPSYLFQAPSKGSMYRWISKIEEAIDMSDKPQNESTTDKRLKEAKLRSMEQQRFRMAPEMRIPDRDDIDSGMEGDVEEVYETSKKLVDNPRLELMKKQLHDLEELVQQLEKEEEAFLGGSLSHLTRRCEFHSTTTKDYFLIPGHSRTLIPKGTELTVLGQLPNNRWRCCVELPRSKSAGLANGQHLESSSEVESISSFDTADDENITNTKPNTDILIGSVPNSLLNDLSNLISCKLKCEDGTPVASPGVTPQLSPFPSPPHSPYSPHKNNRDSSPGKRSSLRRSIASENLSEQDIWEQFCIPSPPSSPVTSRSTSPSMCLSCSPGGSLEDLDFVDKESCETVNPEENKECSEVILRQGREKDERDLSVLKSRREATFMIDDIPETYIGSDSEDDRMVTVIDEVPPHELLDSENIEQEPVKMRVKKDQSHRDSDTESIASLQPNYAFLVTKKLRQRGISLIVGSSSSEDENDDDKDMGPLSRLSRRRLDKEFLQFESEGTEQEIRPYSAFVPRKQVGITLSREVQNFVPRTSTRNELLRDYSSPSDKPSPMIRSNTLTTFEKLGDWSSTENAPPINQRRTLQLSKDSSAGFGFTLQTYGIVQQSGEVANTTFVLSVEEDGPAYMAGLRPGDLILEVDGESVEKVDHKEVVARIHQASKSVRLVAVFVDALRRMKMNTRLKLLQTSIPIRRSMGRLIAKNDAMKDLEKKISPPTAELADKELLFQELCKREDEILQGKGISSSEMSSLDLPRERTNSFLYTHELTSTFSKQSPNVHDSVLQYRQALHDKEARRSSLPDGVELGKQRITATTGSEMLKKFSSPDLSAQRRKPISAKLIKSFRKKKPSVESFKSYLELDLDAENPGKEEETGSDTPGPDVFEPALTTAEATATAVLDEPRTLEREAPVTSNFTPLEENPKLSSLIRSNSEQNSSTLYKEFSENPDVSNQDRIAPGIAQMKKRFEKSSSSKTLPTKSLKPAQDERNGNTLGFNALRMAEFHELNQRQTPSS